MLHQEERCKNTSGPEKATLSCNQGEKQKLHREAGNLAMNGPTRRSTKTLTKTSCHMTGSRTSKLTRSSHPIPTLSITMLLLVKTLWFSCHTSHQMASVTMLKHPQIRVTMGQIRVKSYINPHQNLNYFYRPSPHS